MINPAFRSALFSAQQPVWNIVDSLYQGTAAMRSAGKQFLIKNEKESETDYINRLNRSTLYNVYRKSIQQAVGRAFSSDIILEGYPGEITLFSQDVDCCGKDITQFSKSVFTDALHHGISYILIDFPKQPDQPLTLADSINLGHRPYWIHITAPQVLAAYSMLEGGVMRLKHFRFQESFIDVSENGLTEIAVEQVKSFDMKDSVVSFTVYRRDNQSDWIIYDEGVIAGLTEIPVVAVYTNRTGFFLGSPPLIDLAYQNLAWWNSASEQTWITHIARVPFLRISGMGPAAPDEYGNPKEMEISIHSVLTLPEGGTAEWVETNGNALAAGMEDLKALEERMESLGLAMTTPKPGTITATETAVNAGESSSILRDYALACCDALEQAIYFTSLFLGIKPADGSVSIDTSMTVDMAQTNTTTQPKSKTAVETNQNDTQGA
jgi:hypothetical protein